MILDENKQLRNIETNIDALHMIFIFAINSRQIINNLEILKKKTQHCNEIMMQQLCRFHCFIFTLSSLEHLIFLTGTV